MTYLFWIFLAFFVTLALYIVHRQKVVTF